MINSLLASQAFQKLFQDSAENRLCFECGSPNPTWASLPNAIFLCLSCSGIHRSLGVHISFVRSINMDSWSEKQLKMMMLGGNDKLKEYFNSIGMYNEEYRNNDIQWKYRTKGASYYRETIRARVEEREIPPPLDIAEATMEDSTLVRANPIISNQQTMNIQYQPMQMKPEKDNDPLDKVKDFLVTGYEKTSVVAKDAMKKVEEKYRDEQFQAKLTQYKSEISTKSTEIAEKSKVVAEKGYITVKEGATSAWGFLKKKFNEIQNKQDRKQQEPFDILQTNNIETQVDAKPEEQFEIKSEGQISNNQMNENTQVVNQKNNDNADLLN